MSGESGSATSSKPKAAPFVWLVVGACLLLGFVGYVAVESRPDPELARIAAERKRLDDLISARREEKRQFAETTAKCLDAQLNDIGIVELAERSPAAWPLGWHNDQALFRAKGLPECQNSLPPPAYGTCYRREMSLYNYDTLRTWGVSARIERKHIPAFELALQRCGVEDFEVKLHELVAGDLYEALAKYSLRYQSALVDLKPRVDALHARYEQALEQRRKEVAARRLEEERALEKKYLRPASSHP